MSSKIQAVLLKSCIVLVLAPGLFVLGCSKGSTVPVGFSATGVWVGQLDNQPFRMELEETPAGDITGAVTLHWWYGSPATLTINDGQLEGGNELNLDLSDPIGPPFGCGISITGMLTNADEASGEFLGRCGHDPAFRASWTATRQKEQA